MITFTYHQKYTNLLGESCQVLIYSSKFKHYSLAFLLMSSCGMTLGSGTLIKHKA